MNISYSNKISKIVLKFLSYYKQIERGLDFEWPNESTVQKLAEVWPCFV